MEEIKVNEYVRTIDGYIRKIEQVNRKGSYDGLCHGAYNVDIPYKYSQGISAKKIKSHSPNIIDLIEVNDFVNGHLVTNIEIDKNNKRKIITENKYFDKYYEDGIAKIGTIVTHEQFNQVKYEV